MILRLRGSVTRPTVGGFAGRLLLLTVTVAACGGGGGGGGQQISRPDVFYVRVTGDDANAGTSADEAFSSIGRAISAATDGDRIVVGPGTYKEMVDINRLGGLPEAPVFLVADPSGKLTLDEPGAVTIDAKDLPAGIRLTRSTFVVIDGFTINGARGSNAAGVHVRSASNNVTVRNCEVSNNRDGIRVQDSDDLFVFNNLIVRNNNRGIRIGATSTGPGSQRARLINNTVADNGGTGIAIGDDAAASRDAFLRNNIVQGNVPRNVDIAGNAPSSRDGYDANFNLVFPDTYGPFAPRGANDINEDAHFVNQERGDYHLDQRDSPAVDAADPETDAGLRDMLEKGSTASNGRLDSNAELDLGYHFPG